MKLEKIKVEITFNRNILGSLPGNKEVFQDFIASKAETNKRVEEEMACITETLEKGTTVFPRDDKGVFFWDYQIKGFFKGTIGDLIEKGKLSMSKWMFKKVVDNTLYITHEKNYLMNEGKFITEPLGHFERPLRADTMQGPRITLARSEVIERGATCVFEVGIDPSSNPKSPYRLMTMDLVRQCLDNGELMGLGQWRSGSMGRFTWKEIAG